MECNPTRVCELLVGLPEMNVLGVDDDRGAGLRVHFESRVERAWCWSCGGAATVTDRPLVELVDLPAVGQLDWCGASIGGPTADANATGVRGPRKTCGSRRRGR